MKTYRVMIKTIEIIHTSYLVDAENRDHAKDEYERQKKENDLGEGKIKGQDILKEEIDSIEEF